MSARIRVLVVDDSVEDLTAASRHLQRSTNNRFTVYTATSIEAGLAAAVELEPDCILIDYELHDGTGLDFLAALYVRKIFIPTIALTGGEDERLAVAFMRHGARDFIKKRDISAETLDDAISRVIEAGNLRRSFDQARIREADTASRLEAALGRASFLAHVSKRFAASLEPDETIKLIASLARPMLGDACIVDLVDASVLYRRSVTLEEERYPEGTDARLARVSPTVDAAEGVPAVVRSLQAARYDGAAVGSVARDDADVALLEAHGLASLAIVPLISGGKCLGAVTLGSMSPAYYGDEIGMLVEEFVQRGATALANARALEGMRLARDQAESARRRLAFQSRVSSLLARSLDWESTFARLTRIFVASLCDTAEIHLADGERGGTRRVAAASGDTKVAALVTRLRRLRTARDDDSRGIARCIARGRPIMYGDELADLIRGSEGERRAILAEWAPTAAIYAPIVLRGNVVGVIAIYRDRSGGTFTLDDLALVEDTARRAAIYYETARSYEREHSIASTLQTSLLPNRIPDRPDIRFASRYLAGADGMDVGGDWYDVVETDDGRYVITLGDVVGRGVLAAAAMGQLRDILRAYAFENFAPARALERLNALLDRTGGEHFATAVYLVYDPGASRLTYANAGHPPPLLVHPDRSVTALQEAAGTPIGAWADAAYGEATVAFPPGSTLLLYTDGLVETRTRSVVDGIDELTETLRTAPSDPEDLVDAAIAGVAPNHSDDTALLALRSMPAAELGRRVWTRTTLDGRAAMLLRTEVARHLERLVPASSLADALLVLGELLGNVVRHAPGAVRVCVDVSGDETTLDVEDRGPGLAAASPEIGDDLERTSGRGLAIVRALAEDVAVLPRRGGGTSVRVRIRPPVALAR